MPERHDAPDASRASSPDGLKAGEGENPLPAMSGELARLAALAAQCGGGFIPVPGKFILDAKYLAHFMGTDEETVRRYINDSNTPTIQPGRRRFVDTSEFVK